MLADFADDADVLLVGSEHAEVVEGPAALRISAADDVAWLFAEGELVIVTDAHPRRRPYRLTGVLQRKGRRWLWKHFHRSEPAG